MTAAAGQGVETLVGPRGIRLSGGQVQRAAAARMLVAKPEFIGVAAAGQWNGPDRLSNCLRRGLLGCGEAYHRDEYQNAEYPYPLLNHGY